MKFRIEVENHNHAIAYNDKGEIIGEVYKVIFSKSLKTEFIAYLSGGLTKTVNSLDKGIKYLEKVLTKIK